MTDSAVRPYLLLSGTLFALVALLHLVRVLQGWAFELGPWSVPVSVSVVGTLVPAALSLWAFRLSRPEL